MTNTRKEARLFMVALTLMLMPGLAQAHVTLQTSQPLRPKGNATVIMNVPNERFVDTTQITLTVPEAFLSAGGRLSRVVFPPGWTVTFEKQDKPGEILEREKDARRTRDGAQEPAAGRDSKAANSNEEAKENQAMDEMRKKWITKVIFSGGVIPVDGFQQFQISFQLPEHAGVYRFPAVQRYADGKDIFWSELVQGAAHPAASLIVQKAPLVSYSELPLPLSGLALFIAIAGAFKRNRSLKETDGKRPVLSNTNKLAEA